MRIKTIDAITGGEVLAEAIMNDKKNVLIPAGTVIKVDYIPLIESFGIDSIMIEDPYENFEEPNPLLEPSRFHSYVERVKNVLEKHIYHGEASLQEIEIIAHEMVKEVNEISSDAIFDMNERTANLYEHTVMVSLLSVMVAKKLKLDEKKKYNIAVGCLLHDIGIRYITVPYENRDMETGDPMQVFEYKKHTILGYSALEEDWIPEISKKMVLSHHEKQDGTGFPMRQKNKEIECKIIQAVDAFDCYISGMEHKRTFVREAVERIADEAGSGYEQKIVEQLFSMIARYPVGTTVKTNEEEKGVVISQTNDPESPIIMIIQTDDKKDKEDKKYNLMLEKNISILQVV